MSYSLLRWSYALAITANLALVGGPASADCGYRTTPATGPTGTLLLAEAQIPVVIAERMQTLRTDARKALIEGGVRRFTKLRTADDHGRRAAK